MADIIIKTAPQEHKPYLFAADKAGDNNGKINTPQEAQAAREVFCDNQPSQCRANLRDNKGLFGFLEKHKYDLTKPYFNSVSLVLYLGSKIRTWEKIIKTTKQPDQFCKVIGELNKAIQSNIPIVLKRRILFLLITILKTTSPVHKHREALANAITLKNILLSFSRSSSDKSLQKLAKEGIKQVLTGTFLDTPYQSIKDGMMQLFGNILTDPNISSTIHQETLSLLIKFCSQGRPGRVTYLENSHVIFNDLLKKQGNDNTIKKINGLLLKELDKQHKLLAGEIRGFSKDPRETQRLLLLIFGVIQKRFKSTTLLLNNLHLLIVALKKLGLSVNKIKKTLFAFLKNARPITVPMTIGGPSAIRRGGAPYAFRNVSSILASTTKTIKMLEALGLNKKQILELTLPLLLEKPDLYYSSVVDYAIEIMARIISFLKSKGHDKNAIYTSLKTVIDATKGKALIYTALSTFFASLTYSKFSSSEFRGKLSVKALCKEINKKSRSASSFRSKDNTIKRLNEYVNTRWYRDFLPTKGGQKAILPAEIKPYLKSMPRQRYFATLMNNYGNRLLLEANYPNHCPKKRRRINLVKAANFIKAVANLPFGGPTTYGDPGKNYNYKMQLMMRIPFLIDIGASEQQIANFAKRESLKLTGVPIRYWHNLINLVSYFHNNGYSAQEIFYHLYRTRHLHYAHYYNQRFKIMLSFLKELDALKIAGQRKNKLLELSYRCGKHDYRFGCKNILTRLKAGMTHDKIKAQLQKSYLCPP